MPDNSWQQIITAAEEDGPALTTSTSEVSILPAAAKAQLGPGTFNRKGKKFRLLAAGRVSNIVTTPGTLTFRVKLGPTANIAVATSPAFQLNAVAKTNVTWVLEWLLTLRAIGGTTAANFMHHGRWLSESVVGSGLPSAGGSGALLIPASAPAVGTGFDSTVALNILDLTAQFSISNSGNNLTLHDFLFESLN